MESLSALRKKGERGSGYPLAGAPPIFWSRGDYDESAFDPDGRDPPRVAEGASCSPQSLRPKDRPVRRG